MSRVGDTLKFRDNGISVEDARKKMLEAGQAPSEIAREVKKNEAVGVVSAPAPTSSTPTQRVEPVSPAPTPVPVVDNQPKVDRYENNKFTAEIRQEDGKWIADIAYKNGAGPERFIASTKNDLLRDLLLGKANATLRVREVTRQQKVGGPDVDKTYILPEGFSEEAFSALPQEAKDSLVSDWALKNALIFCESNRDFYANDENSDTLERFLINKGLPFTVRNFEYAYKELGPDGDDILHRRPSPATPVLVPSVSAPAPVVVDSTPVAAPAPAPVSTEAPALVAPAPQVRKRGTTGLVPGFSSSGTTELDAQEESTESREPSEAELRKLSPEELNLRYRETMAARRRARGQF